MEVWQRTLRVLWVVQFLTTLAMNLGLVFVPFFLSTDPLLAVRDEDTRKIYTGLILAGPFCTTILFTPLWGWVADRTGPKKQVVRACFGLGLTQLLMALARSPDQLVAIRMLQGMISGVIAANLGLVSAVTPKEQQGYAIATLQSATPAGHILGPVLGSLLATALGFRTTYVILGSMILGTGVLSWLLLRQEGFVPTTSTNPFVSLYRAGRGAVRQPLLRQALGILVIGQFAFMVAQAVFGIYAGALIQQHVAANGVTPGWWNDGIGFTAIAMAVTGLANVLCSSWWGRFHDRRVPYLTPIGATLIAASMLLLAAWPAWWLVLLARVGIGVGIGAMSTLQFAILSGAAGAAERGQMMSLATSLTHLGNLLGLVLGGVLATWWTEAGNFALAAAAYGIVALGALRLEMRARHAEGTVVETPAENVAC